MSTNGCGQHVFKTRSIAKAAIEGGKVHHNNERVKFLKKFVSVWSSLFNKVSIKTVVVKALSNTRGPAPVAQQLYEETEVSIARRELIASQRKLHNLARPDHRPSKKDRRQINRFKQDNDQHYEDHWSYNDE